MIDVETANTVRNESGNGGRVKRMLARLLTIAVALFLTGLLLPSTSPAQPAPSAPSSLIVKLVAGLSADEQVAVITRNGGTETSSVRALRLHIVQVDTDQLDAILANYQADPQVVRAEVNQTRESNAIPSDPLYPSQWALRQI